MEKLANGITYALRSYGKIIFLLVAGAVACVFLFVSDRLIKDLAEQERERMEIWADATKEIIKITSSGPDAPVATDIEFLITIIARNTTIPVLLTDENHNILQYRNFNLPDPDNDTADTQTLSNKNKQFLDDKLQKLMHTPNVIDIEIAQGVSQHLYYEDSTLLKRLTYYPLAQLAIMVIFILVVYFAVVSSKKAEQNKVWVGLSKETAHQLGTPISSLMAWMELLPDMGVDADTVSEMDKDVNRLSMIASRFSKIGSVPTMEDADVNQVVSHAVEYMKSRISQHVGITLDLCEKALPAKMSPPLLEWVMENLIKNAVDAMEGHGKINVSTSQIGTMAIIDVADTGKGINKKHFKSIFKPGYTTKRRGWGLGLALAKRIVTEYHLGKIFVKSSTIKAGTTFRIEIPLNT